MILVTVGTQTMSFIRMLDEVRNLVENGDISSQIVIQSGYTPFKFIHENVTILDFAGLDELKELQIKSDIIITHGGVGSILEALSLNKKVIAVPRLRKYHEHINDHQIEIVENFAMLNYLIPVYNIKDLCCAIKSINDFMPTPYISTKREVIKFLKEQIDSM